MEEKIIQEEAQQLLEKAGISATVKVEKNEDIYNVVIDSEENPILIGKHGNTLSSLEFVLSLIVAQKTGEFKRIILEIGGYRQEREEYLKGLVSRLKEDVVATGMEKEVRGLKPWERRLIHLYLQEDTDVATESVGEDRDRTLIIKKK